MEEYSEILNVKCKVMHLESSVSLPRFQLGMNRIRDRIIHLHSSLSRHDTLDVEARDV